MRAQLPLNEPPISLMHAQFENCEERRQVFLMYLGNGLACALLLVFGTVALRANYPVVAFVTLLHATICSINLLLLKTTGRLRLVRYGFLGGILMLYTFLIASGGIDQTGPMWAYPLAAATIFLQGARRGLWLIALMLAIAVLVFFGPLAITGMAVYALDFKIRFLSSFGALALFAGLHEYARARNQAQLLHVSAQLDRLSHTDQLTALPNRRYMANRLEAENSRYDRHRRAYSIVFADIDHFKSINDRFGHQVGDAALRAVAQTLRGQLRCADEICRWGGEEFLLLLPETDTVRAIDVAEKLRAAIANLEVPHGDTLLHLSMSFGVHTVDGAQPIDTLIDLADQKLYLAKQRGRNRVVAQLSPSPAAAPADAKLAFSIA